MIKQLYFNYYSKVKEIDPTHENAFVKAKMIKFFKTQGIDEPTETTKSF